MWWRKVKRAESALFARPVHRRLQRIITQGTFEHLIADDEGGFEVVCDPYQFSAIRETLQKAGFQPEMAEVTMKPSTYTDITGDDAIKMQKLLDALENLDDVQEVYTNAIIES